MPGTRYVLAPEASVMVSTVLSAVSTLKSYFFSMGVWLGSAHLGLVLSIGHSQLHTTAVPITSSICTFSALGVWKEGQEALQKSTPFKQ
jgi:hypothetical protein